MSFYKRYYPQNNLLVTCHQEFIYLFITTCHISDNFILSVIPSIKCMLFIYLILSFLTAILSVYINGLFLSVCTEGYSNDIVHR
jgi:hypothetical protein